MSGRFWWKLVGLRQKLCQWLISIGLRSPWIAERAVYRLHPELAALAAAQAADLYIGHYPGGLGASALAAKRHGATLGYDLEDCYFIQHEEGTSRRIAIEIVERRHLSLVKHLTASTRLIGAAVASHYGVGASVEVRNCFDPVNEAPRPHSGLPRCLWFSQSISLQRGLDVVFEALSRCRAPLTLDLRGWCYPHDRLLIDERINALGLADRVCFLQPVAPYDLIEEAAAYDIGFAAEIEDDANRALTATNKFFSYLAAGLAVAATDMPGQREAAEGIGAAVSFYRLGDTEELCCILERWSSSSDALMASRRASHDAASGSWGWRAESSKLVSAVADTLSLRQLRDDESTATVTP